MSSTPKVLIANRGAISCRVSRTLKRLGYGSVAVYSEADKASLHVDAADEAVLIGPPAPKESYLDTEKVLAAAKATGATAIHPGYGFLSENPEFARACEAAGIAFVGPTPDQMVKFGLKHTAREIAMESGVPLLPGTGLLANVDEAVERAQGIGYPVMLKSTAGGGGIGMRVCENDSDLRAQFESVQRLSMANFKDSGLFLEKFVRHARHIEVQIFGDGAGRVLALGERDCSVQRRNQKVIEETPAPHLSTEGRAELLSCAERLGKAVNYRSAGTVEFVYDADSRKFYFLEVNTRLQVEHGVTEEVLGIDLVEWMVRLAAGDLGFWPETLPVSRGHSIQARVYAEDPARNFQPSSGLLTAAAWPPEARVETWVTQGVTVSPFYDPLVAKVIVHAADREQAVAALSSALEGTTLAGIETNRSYLQSVLQHAPFLAGHATTRMLSEFAWQPHTMEVLEPGAVTTVQDFPGRLGYWDIGVPPSGPMDDVSFRLANRLVGNDDHAAGLEITMAGPTLKFQQASTVALTGARMKPTLNGEAVPMDTAIAIPAGGILKTGRLGDTGVRAYLAVSGGLDVPVYLGSRSTFTLGGFGGHAGRALRAGDIIHLGAAVETGIAPAAEVAAPSWKNEWIIRVTYGPHGAPDFFTNEDIETFFATAWKVHYNSNPTGIRLIGPKPRWARTDGGEAGLHPSNIHDNAYAIGAIDYTGDMPIILGPDGPSCGGFVCPAVIIRADRWMMGQLRPGDTLRFLPVTLTEAEAAERTTDAGLDALNYATAAEIPGPVVAAALESPVAALRPATDTQVEVRYRAAGDKYLLVEYGPLVLDITLRARVHALMEWVRKQHLPGLIDLTPGIRSLQFHYDNRVMPRTELLALLARAEDELGDLQNFEVPSRIVYLPLSWDDPATRLAIEKYMQSVRPDAPWCPSNIEFIRRINGLESIEEVQRIVFDASYMVMGLGDVYLGAPVATPLDPRHRLVTTKYNPARTWTPENAVGIGGAYMCVYGMEGPGGYQFVGRTIQMWNAWRQTQDFTGGKPWLLRFFDQIRFYPVSAEELLKLREEFPLGRFQLKIEETTFKLGDYLDFLEQNAESIADFRSTQRQAFQEERERWAAAGQNVVASEPEAEPPPVEDELAPEGCELVRTPLTGNLWKVLVEPGQEVKEGQAVVIVEAMKMEAEIVSPASGRVREIRVAAGKQVQSGQALIVVDTAA
ncbi:urea carboxylase [Verrucomicrobium sp. BvORR034]|uniref:urea carboxylase n=1 Tax=Verrucomicrobium sp. BvORR034 TaxID=1396418 RepID=UPI0006786002|nr:urea carboxylase [Verrucomicrobium sp. BvORR034]